jgi:glycosyltransferase involved in cell wall biosynthesis
MARVLGARGVAMVRRVRARQSGGARAARARQLAAARDDMQYHRWLGVHDPDDATLERLRGENPGWPYRPLVSVVVPVYNPAPQWLDDMIESVQSQVYDNWELCIADDRSPDPAVGEALRRWASTDPRIKVVFRPQNGNIAAASNSALELATGEFIALLDHDDVLRPHALHAVVAALQADRDADILYSDEDKILLDGSRGQVVFKGEYDPDYILSTNYVCHLSVFRRSLVSEVDGFRAGLDGSQDHDLVLRTAERAARIVHIPDVLYSWKQVTGSAALAYEEKPAAWTAGLRAVQDALDRRDTGARAEYGPGVGTYTVRYPLPSRCSVRLIILAFHDERTVRTARLELGRNTGVADVSWHVAAVDASFDSLRDTATRITVITDASRHARLLNVAAAAGSSDVTVFVDGDLVPSTGGKAWLAPLVEQAIRDGVGASGGRILAVDGSAEHEGLHVGGPSLAESIGVRYPVIQGAAALSGGCLAIRSRLFEELGGFDDRYRTSLYDVDLCLRARRAGYSCVYTPLTELRRLRPRRGAVPRRFRSPSTDDVATFRATWEGSRQFSDPYVSPWVDRVHPLVLRQR